MRLDLPVREILEAVPDALLVADDSGVIVMVNQQAEVLFRYPRGELVGLSIEDLMPTRFQARHVQHRQHFIVHPRKRVVGEKLDVALVCQRKDGSEFQAEISLGPFECEQGLFVASAIRDITARALENQKLSQLLDASADAMIVINVDGEMVLVNTQTEVLFGYPRDALLGKSIDMLLPERFRAAHATHRKTFFHTPRVRPMGQGQAALFGRKQNGEEFHLEISLSPVQTANGLLISSAIRDISAHVEIEQELAVAKEMAERASTSKSRFLAAASHDLRQPLQSLTLYFSVLSGVIKGDKQQQILGNMQLSLDTMSELLNSLLDISRFEGGTVVAEKQDVHLHEIISPLIANNMQQAQEKGVLLECIGIDCVVHSDPGLLKRIIENFVTNAVRYTEHGRVTIDCHRDNGIARISVTDTGIGIPEEALHSIFQEHYQLENTSRDRRQGLGLGLSIVEHIAHLLDHSLTVSSVLGEGSTFSLDVPLGTSKSVQKSRKSINDTYVEADRHPHILLVDDDPSVLDAATLLLESLGAIVHGAHNGKDALVHLQAGVRPDLLVSDYGLPDCSGIELARRVRRAAMEHLPIVILTGDMSEQVVEATTLDNCIVLHKPIKGEQLISIVNSLQI